jgi:hypothetical protein
VATEVTPRLHGQLWPLCSNRHLAVLQAKTNAANLRGDDPLDAVRAPSDLRLRARALELLRLSVADSAARAFDTFYATVGATTWATIVSTAWSGAEHINALELRAVLLAVHWVLSFPSSLCSRVFLLLDSTVAFFSLWKGRSSSPGLLLILRKISALLLAGGLSLLPGWVPSAVNPADAPSRLQPAPCPPGRTAA